MAFHLFDCLDMGTSPVLGNLSRSVCVCVHALYFMSQSSGIAYYIAIYHPNTLVASSICSYIHIVQLCYIMWMVKN